MPHPLMLRFSRCMLPAACFAAVALFTPRPVMAQRIALSVSPPLVELSVAPGGDRTFPITLTNEGTQPLTVQAQITDLTLDETGNPQPQPAGTTAFSAAAWLSLDTTQLILPPGKQQSLRCRVRVPRGSSGGGGAVLLFTAARPGTSSGTALRFVTRTGTVLLLKIAHSARLSAAVRDFTAVRDGNGLRCSVALENTGNAYFCAAGEVLLRDGQGRVAARLKLAGGTGTLLPGGTRRFNGRWQGRTLPPGEYRAIVRFTAPGLRDVSAEYKLSL